MPLTQSMSRQKQYLKGQRRSLEGYKDAKVYMYLLAWQRNAGSAVKDFDVYNVLAIAYCTGTNIGLLPWF